MGVGTVGDESVAQLLELDFQGLSVLQHLFLVFSELWGGSLLQGSGQGRDGVVVWTTLVTWEDREVNWVFQVVVDLLTGLRVDGSDALSVENHSTSWTSQGLVGGGGDNVSVFEWRWNDAGSNQTGDVGHVDNQVGADLVGDFPHSLVVDQSAVGRGTGDQDLWSEQNGGFLQHVVVNQAGAQVDSVRHGFEVRRHSRDLSGVGLVTVGQVATMGQVETHQSVVWLHDGLVDLQVGWRARQGLDVDAPLLRVQVEGLQGSGLAQQLDSVDVLVTTVVSGARVTFGVLVAHWGSQGVEDCRGREIFGGNQVDGVLLSVDFVLDDLGNLRVGFLQVARDHSSVGGGKGVVDHCVQLGGLCVYVNVQCDLF